MYVDLVKVQRVICRDRANGIADHYMYSLASAHCI